MITSKDYDKRIISGGLQHQIDNYYAPIEPPMKKRIEVVMSVLQPKPGENILDIGCGSGTFVFHCAKAGSFAIGLDYSFESIKAAKELCSRFGVGQNTGFVIADACNLPFKEVFFDKVVAADFIEHITFRQKEAVVEEVLRVLKPQGEAVIFTPNGTREKIGELYWKIRNIMFGDKLPKTELHFGLTNRKEFEKICGRNKFKFKLYYKDITRPYLAKIPFLRGLLALNLLWVLKLDSRRLKRRLSRE